MSLDEIEIEKLRGLLMFDADNPLLFNTGLFLILFLAFIGIYQLLRKWQTAKMVFVILFSLYFYYKSSAEYCFILLGICVSDYLLGIFLERSDKTWQRKSIVAFNVIINVGMLVYFKYFNLLYSTLTNFLHSVPLVILWIFIVTKSRLVTIFSATLFI